MYFRGFEHDNTTFGMDINTSPAFRNFCKNLQRKELTTRLGLKHKVLTCPAKYVAPMMGDAGWLVSEEQAFYKVQVEGSKQVQECVYIEYPDGIWWEY